MGSDSNGSTKDNNNDVCKSLQEVKYQCGIVQVTYGTDIELY